MSAPPLAPPIKISGLGALSALGEDLTQHELALRASTSNFQPLSELFGKSSPFADHPAAWIPNRNLLVHRKWSPSTMAALHVAKQAVHTAGWNEQERKTAGLVMASSRGNAAGWLGPWPGRRPFRLMATSNTMHGEPAAAICIEFGIHGPNHVVASGCSAGLDAIGIAMMMLRSGLCERVLTVAVELPLVPILLENYSASGLLSKSFHPDPYHPDSDGFIPGEGAAAMTLEMHKPTDDGVTLSHYSCNSDATDPIGIPKDGGRTVDLFQTIQSGLGRIDAICPHATGTAVQRIADPAWMRRVFGDSIPPIIPLKPMIGHTIGASGMLESVLIAAFMHRHTLPPVPAGLHHPEDIMIRDPQSPCIGSVAKVAHSMGGHNALLIMNPAR